MNCRRLQILSFPFCLCTSVEKRKQKRQNESGREAYKDVRPAPLDVRQRGTPELGFPFAEDVPLFRGNLFRACRSVRSEMQGFRRADGEPEVESGYARCQILRAMPPSLSSFVTTTAGAVFRRFFAVFFFYFLSLLPLCLCTFRGRAEFQS